MPHQPSTRGSSGGVRAEPVSTSGTTVASMSPMRSRVGTAGDDGPAGVAVTSVASAATAGIAAGADGADVLTGLTSSPATETGSKGSSCAVTAQPNRATTAARHSRSRFMSEPGVDPKGTAPCAAGRRSRPVLLGRLAPRPVCPSRRGGLRMRRRSGKARRAWSARGAWGRDPPGPQGRSGTVGPVGPWAPSPGCPPCRRRCGLPSSTRPGPAW